MIRLLLVVSLVLASSPATAQDDCTFDLAPAIELLEVAETVDDVAEARALIELQEAQCRDFAPDEAGDSRTNPVPFGQRQQAETFDFIAAIELTNYLDDGEEFVLNANDRNEPAPDGKRYIVVEMKFACANEPSETCEFSRVHFSAVGDKGVSYPYDAGSNLDIRVRDIGDEQEIFGGSEIDVALAFLIDADDSNLIIFTEYGRPRTFFATE